MLQAPFPWFGGKSRAASLIWSRLGDVPNYVEPFFGSGAVLLGRPHQPGIETVNDLDGFVANLWRSIRYHPEAVAEWADNPVNEADLHARHLWLLERRAELSSRLMGDPEWCDPKIAGWWAWGASCWIAGGWCAGNGPWVSEGGKMVLGNAGQGVKMQRPHLGRSQGVNRNLPLMAWFAELSARLARVRVCCGDWSRILGPTPTEKLGVTGIVLDPPYADTADRDADCYAVDSLTVAHDVRRWAIENGSNPLLRIALCGYEGEHEMPAEWECVAWKASGGYGSGAGNQNNERERVWFSPACLRPNSGQVALDL